MRYAIGVVLLFVIGCGSSEQITQTETHTILPARIDTIQDAGGYVFYGPTECDTAAILLLYCKGYVGGESGGITYGVGFETRIDTVVQKDTLYVVRAVPVITTNIVRDTIRISDIDTVQVVTVQEFGFWDKLGFALQVIAVIVILGAVGYFVIRSGLKLPF